MVGSSHTHTHTPPPHPLHMPTGLQTRDHRIGAPTLKQALHSAHPSSVSHPCSPWHKENKTSASPRVDERGGPGETKAWRTPWLSWGHVILGGHGHTPPVPPTFLQPSPPPHRDLPGSLVDISSLDKNGHRDRHKFALPRSTARPSWWAGASTFTTRELELEVTRARPAVLEGGGQK